MIDKKLAAAIAWLAVWTTPGLAQTAPPAPTANSWSLDYGEGRCTLQRRGPDAAAQLTLETITGTDEYMLSIPHVGPLSKTSGDPFTSVTLTLQGGKQQIKTLARDMWLAKGGGRAIAISGLDQDFVAAFAKSVTIDLATPAKPKPLGSFPIPSASAAIDAVSKCVADQLVEWGADPAQFTAGGKPAAPLIPRDKWLTGDQIDKISGVRGGDLQAVFRLAIAVDGSVDKCVRIDTAKANEIEKRGCAALVGRHLFAPATNPSGRPVRSAAAFEIATITIVTTENEILPR